MQLNEENVTKIIRKAMTTAGETIDVQGYGGVKDIKLNKDVILQNESNILNMLGQLKIASSGPRDFFDIKNLVVLSNGKGWTKDIRNLYLLYYLGKAANGLAIDSRTGKLRKTSLTRPKIQNEYPTFGDGPEL